METLTNNFKIPTANLNNFRKPKNINELPKGIEMKNPFFLIGNELIKLIENHLYIKEVILQFTPYLFTEYIFKSHEFSFLVEESGMDLVQTSINEDGSVSIECSFKEKNMIEEQDNENFIDLQEASNNIIATIEDCIRTQFYFKINNLEALKKNIKDVNDFDLRLICFFFCTAF